jgi:hypothetical protein
MERPTYRILLESSERKDIMGDTSKLINETFGSKES